MSGSVVFTPNSKFSCSYVAWEGEHGICRAPLLYNGELVGPLSQLDVRGKVLAVGEQGTVAIARGKDLIVWDSEGETIRIDSPYQESGKRCWASVIPPLPSFENHFDHLVKGSREWVVFDNILTWRVEQGAVIQYAPEFRTTVVYLPDRTFVTHIPYIAPSKKVGWVGAINHLVGIAFPELHMVIALGEFRAQITGLACNDVGVAVISGHQAYYSRWEQGPDGTFLLPEWRGCGAAHQVMWNDNNLLVVVRDVEQTRLSCFVV